MEMQMPPANIEPVTMGEVLATWDQPRELGRFVSERYFREELEDVSLD